MNTTAKLILLISLFQDRMNKPEKIYVSKNCMLINKERKEDTDMEYVNVSSLVNWLKNEKHITRETVIEHIELM